MTADAMLVGTADRRSIRAGAVSSGTSARMARPSSRPTRPAPAVVSSPGPARVGPGDHLGIPSSRLAEAIDVAEDLAWRPTSNLPASIGYRERRESADRLVELLAGARLPSDPSDELRFLVEAMRRVARQSFANRRGEPYYARKRAILELRGCVDAYRKATRP